MQSDLWKVIALMLVIAALMFFVFWEAAFAQEPAVDQRIEAAVALHERDRAASPFAEVLHGKRDPLRRSDRDHAVLIGPFRFGGASTPSDPSQPLH
jgi:hypothetical protein